MSSSSKQTKSKTKTQSTKSALDSFPIFPAHLLTPTQHSDIKEAFDLFQSEGKLDQIGIKVSLGALGLLADESVSDLISRATQRIALQKSGEQSARTKRPRKSRLYVPSTLFGPPSDPEYDYQATIDSTSRISDAFKLLDENESGVIQMSNLRQIARELGENITDEEFHQMLHDARTLGGVAATHGQPASSLNKINNNFDETNDPTLSPSNIDTNISSMFQDTNGITLFDFKQVILAAKDIH